MLVCDLRIEIFMKKNFAVRSYFLSKYSIKENKTSETGFCVQIQINCFLSFWGVIIVEVVFKNFSRGVCIASRTLA